MAEKTLAQQEEELRRQLLENAAPNTTTKTAMIDILFDMFKGDDLVVVNNFTESRIGWVYANRNKIKISQPDEFSRFVYGIGGDALDTIIVEPGKKVVVPGYVAYVGFQKFYAQYLNTHSTEFAVDFNSPIKMRAFLAKAYGGIYDPNKKEDVAVEVESDLKEEPTKKQKIDDDLGLHGAKKQK